MPKLSQQQVAKCDTHTHTQRAIFDCLGLIVVCGFVMEPGCNILTLFTFVDFHYLACQAFVPQDDKSTTKSIAQPQPWAFVICFLFSSTIDLESQSGTVPLLLLPLMIAQFAQ